MSSFGSKFVVSEKKFFLHISYGFYVKHYPAVEAIFNFHMENSNFVRDHPIIIRAVWIHFRFAVSVKTH